MTKPKKEIVKELVDKKNAELLQAKIQVVATEIEKILVENKLGLQPFIEFSPYGILPRVKLIETNDEPKETKETK